MSRLAHVYRAQFKTTLAVQLQYRVSLVLWLVGMVMEPVVFLVVWSAVAQSQGGAVGGYTAGDFAAYFIVLMLVNHASDNWVYYEFEGRVRQGTLSPMLLRPLHPIHADVAQNISYKVLTLAIMLPTALALTIVFRPVFHPVGWALGASIPAVLLACAIRFVVEWTLALVAFWVTRMNAIIQMYYVTLLFLSGQVAPLSLFPAPVQAVATALPFRWFLEFPVQLVLGQLSPADALTGFVAQGAWLVMSLALLHVAWARGVRRYSAMGS